ncbi:MAG: maleylpyruvate isomerase family mycothiol-dependent enzyme [Mycobacteriaceae bacterium]|nr:maleylpyruvate isomerase family mycothiol-dependent enzyme [Mycolicibacterium frederiksbergense]MBY0289680.1 maleylpyruvate isomerase family mycothiol-dependent enzyme [Mycobacteriaceae bacterium]
MRNDVWPLVHAERAAMIDDLTRLDDTAWEQPSLCAGWTVHDVVAHLVDVARSTRLGFALDMVRAGFDFDRQNTRGIQRARGGTPGETLQRLREVATRTSIPIAPLDTRLVEEVVHGEDIRRPLGITHTYAQDAIVRSLRQQVRTSTAFGGAKELVAGVRLVATDTDLTIGDGPEVAGPALALLLTVSGRTVAARELDGPGLASLTSA